MGGGACRHPVNKWLLMDAAARADIIQKKACAREAEHARRSFTIILIRSW